MGWLIACLLAVLLFRTRRRLKRLLAALPTPPETESSQPALSSYQNVPLAYQHLHDLIVLSLELGRLREAGRLDPVRYADLVAQISTLWATIVRHLGTTPQSQPWQQARAAAWALLAEQQILLEPPPWSQEEAPAAPLGAEALAPPAHLHDALAHSVVVPPLPAAAAVHVTPTPATPVAAMAAPETLAEAIQPPSPVSPTSASEETASYAWEPAIPSTLERALQAVSGWPALLAPFLVQNIGWFIGGLCFIAGSIFLVAYTTGFAKTLASFAVLSLYTLLLLWGGYQIRRRQPALAMSSSALLILGMLLVPLNVAAAVRLLLVAQRSPGLIALGLLAAGLGVGGLYVTATLVSGIMDRTLQRQHPHLFLALAAIQLAVPLLAQRPVWPLLVVCHGVIVGLLAYGLVRFAAGWLHSIFIERRQLAYYAAGTLVYAALVSFVHVTWGYQEAPVLPRGYYGPLLIVLCGLLFSVDVHLKQWAQHAALLSYASFGIYGVSVVALLLAVEAPLARLCTLSLAVLLYGFVTWQYATLPPLYLLLGCAGWLYHDVVLQHLPYPWYFFASLPGFAGLWAASQWAWQHRATPLALIGYRVLSIALLSVAAWSVVHAQPGWVALGVALVVMVCAFAAPRVVPIPVFGRRGDGGEPALAAQHRWLYLGTFAGVVAAAYAPRLPGPGWAVQFACGLVLLAAIWTALGLRLSRIAREDTVAKSAALLNSAVLHLGVCLGVAVLLGLPDVTRHRALPLLLGLEGGIALWLSLALGVQWLFYGVLGLWGVAGALVKLTYFPALGSGVTTLGVALIVWGVLWWVERAPAEVMVLRQERATLRASQASVLTLLWLFPVEFQPPQAVMRQPLRQAMVLLWGLGVTQLGIRLLAGPLGWMWVVSASLGALVALLLTGALAWPWLFPVALTLGVAAGLAAAFELGVTTVVGLSVVGAVSALLVWRTGVRLLAHPMVRRCARLGHLRGDRVLLEHLAHWTASAMTVVSIGVPLAQYGVFIPGVAFLLTLMTGMAFWCLAGQRYQYRVHRYLVLESGALGVVLSYVWMFHPASVPLVVRWQVLLSAPGLGLTWVLLSLGLWGLAWVTWCSLETAEASVHGLDGAIAGERILYHGPLQVVALQFALLAVAQSLGLVLPAVLGWEYTGGFFVPGVLCLAGMSLLLATHAGFNLGGMVCIVLAVLGTQSLWFHGTPVSALWFGQPLYTDQWFTLAVLALGLASLAQYVDHAPRWAQRYTRPLCAVAALTYSWALLGAVVLFGLLPGQAVAAVAWVFLVLALGLVPLVQPLPGAVAIRGLGMALLLSASVISVLGAGGWHTLERLLFVIWAYALWGLGNFGLPRYNARWPRRAIAPHAWPWLGLLLVCGALVAWGLQWHPESRLATLRPGVYLTAVALYLFLMLRNSTWSGWPWLAVGTLTWAGLAFNAAWLWSWSAASGLVLRLPLIDLAAPWSGVGGTVVWANVLLLGAAAWRHYGPALATHLGWQSHDLNRPLLVWPSAILAVWLLSLAAWDVIAVLVHAWASASILDGLPVVLLGLLLAVSFYHVAWLHSAAWPVHGCIAALFYTLLAAWCETVAQAVHPPLFLALWSVLLVAVVALGAHQRWPATVRAALKVWCDWSPLVAIVVWVPFPHISIAEHLVILGLLGGYAAGLGWQRQHSGWLFVALVVGVIELHGWWLVWLSPQRLALLWPWYTLQLVGLTWLALWAEGRLRRAVETGDDGAMPSSWWRIVPVRPLAQALSWLWPLLAACALLAWGLHLLNVLDHLLMGRAPQWLLGRGEGVVALLAVVALMAVGIRQAQRTRQALWIYGVAVLGGTVWGYLRMLWLGLAPLQVWDTIALIGASYALFILQRLTQSEPVLHVVLLLPLLAVVTVPLQVASVHASVALLTVALLYLSMRQTTGRALPLYMGLLTLNVGIYLWVPEWAHRTHMLQIYAIPAALSVLWLLHAHRHELRPPVLHGCRLAASSILYVSATLDVFLRSEVTIFLAALGLSLAGISIGIALRTRAFLYAGTSFFVLNVVGQLLLLFPEQRLTRAMVLLLLGTVITGSMIWFNIKREAILQRLRIFRADLATWV